MRRTAVVVGFVLAVVFSLAVPAQKVKEPLSALDNLTFSRPELRVTETVADSEAIRGVIPNAKAIDLFRAENGMEWKVTIDQRRGVPALLDGGAIPFIPGPANSLDWNSFASDCSDYSCLPPEQVGKLAYNFMVKYKDVLNLNPDEFEMALDGSHAAGNSIYFARLQWFYAGIPVEGASVFFRINNGNLIQVATEKIGPISLDPVPTLTRDTAWEIVKGYLGEYASEKDRMTDKGSLRIIPITPAGLSADVFGGGYGTQIGYSLVYRFSFTRPGVTGAWEALVDAHSGEILRFVDAMRYGHIHGGIRPSDGLPPEEDRPFPGADIGGGLYTDSAGNFSGTSATTTLTGKYCHISDACGSISASTTTGDINFGAGATGTDCTVPTGNTYGLGNTKPSRTLFYNVSNINVRAQVWNPGNTWLTDPSNAVTCHVNGTAQCNAGSSGPDIYFYKAASGCNNLGEIPGVAMHEWGHSYDSSDGSGGQSPPLETYADWTAIMSTHNSCTGAGFLTSGNCGGYGNACTACSGVRDCDYLKHSPATPWTSALNGSLYNCSAGSYNGPCGWEDHCESGISTQALWDFAARDLEAAPTSMDLTSAWMLEDRLWFTGVQTLQSMYTCSSGATSGCTGNVLYTVMRAIDDDGDGTANGTPHAAAIFAALNRHGIACGTASDATNQNHVSSSCPPMAVSQLNATGSCNEATLSWAAVAGATRYFIFRNESGCSAGFTRVAKVDASTTTYKDNEVVNDITYYYVFQAATDNDSCVSAVSNCASATPKSCAGSVLLDKAKYNCASTVSVSVLDSTPGSSPWTAQAWSTTDTGHKTIALTNNPLGSITYTGSFTTTTSASPGPTEIRVADGDTITVRFVDPDYCGTPNQNVDTTATIDCAGPVISNVQVTNIADSSATVTWTTSEAANSRVTYGTSAPPSTNKDDLAAYVTSHSVTLTGLTTCSDYYFSVTSADVSGNGTTDTKSGAYYNFTTLGRAYAFGPDHVEGGTNGWTATGTAGSIWHIDTCRSSSATHAWKAGASDAPTCSADYGNSVTTDLASSTFALGSAGHGMHLRWNEWYSTESGYDFCQPQISTDGGTSWTNLVTTPYSGSSGGWVAKDVDLALYTGATVKIRFHFTSDSGVVAEGWYVDDIDVSKPQACGPSLSHQSHSFTDACNGTGSGSGDGVIDPGEDVVLQVTLFNGGSSGTTGVNATLATSTPGVTVTDNYAAFPDIAAGGTGASQANHFSFKVDPSVSCGTTLNFSIHMVSSEKPLGWDDSFSLTVGNVAPGNSTPINEAFTTGDPPAGWTRVNGGTGTQQWTTGNPGGRSTPGGMTAPFEIIDSDYDGSGSTQDDSLITPAFNCTGATAVTLAFDTYFNWYSSADYAYIDVSNDNGATWQNKATWTADVGSSTTASHQVMDITSLAGTSSNAKVRFRYVGSYGWYWLVDNVKIDITAPGSCTVNACAPSAPPGEVAPGDSPATAMNWTGKTTLGWPAAAGASGYKVYRGLLAGLPNLLNSNVDSCTKYESTGTSCTVNDDPTGVAGNFYWYIVTGTNAGGEGTAGNASGQARIVNSSGTCP